MLQRLEEEQTRQSVDSDDEEEDIASLARRFEHVHLGKNAVTHCDQIKPNLSRNRVSRGNMAVFDCRGEKAISRHCRRPSIVRSTHGIRTSRRTSALVEHPIGFRR
jgi:hypothetical protein